MLVMKRDNKALARATALADPVAEAAKLRKLLRLAEDKRGKTK